MTTRIVKKQYTEGEGLSITFYDEEIVIGEACTVYFDGKANSFLHGLKVKEEYQRKGYGSQILKYMIDNYNVRTLYVDKNNEIAIKLYKKFGFRKIDSFYNKYIMKREISEKLE